VISKRNCLILAAVVVVVVIACAHVTEADKSRTQANTVGKYKVRLTEDSEAVQGHCKFLRYIEPDYDPIQRPTPSQLNNYFQVEGVLLGADTVLVRGRVGEAYICGPGPLNPDGSLRDPFPSMAPTPH
jgi:hypothetical protein